MAELDAFLVSATAEYDSKLADEFISEQLKAEFDEALNEFDDLTAFRFDIEQKNTRALIADSDKRDRVYEDAVQLRRALVLMHGMRKNPDEVDASTIKKIIMAEFFVYADYDHESRWLALGDRLMPGVEGLDFGSYADLTYVRDALYTKADRDNKKRVFKDVVMQCIQHLIEEAPGDYVETDDYLEALKRCSDVYSLKDDGQKQARIDEVVRVSKLSPQSVRPICDAYSNYYQKTGGYFPFSLV